MKIELEAPLHSSFRVQQIAGMFDVPLAEKVQHTIEADVPPMEELKKNPNWKIGLIVGPSGSGKSTVAKYLFPEEFEALPLWDARSAVVDGFNPRMSIRDVTSLLTAVGFSSPPGWVKPYGVLSNGEKFRCDLARALSKCKLEEGENPIVVFDEFTSVVDRTVAKIASAAVSKGIHSGNIPGRFVAVSCHYDIAEWLEPEWILDMQMKHLYWRRLRRPRIGIDVFKADRRLWPVFKPFHYLNGALNPTAQNYIALWDETPVGFCSVLAMIGKKGHRRIHRLVVLPDFQGVGIGTKLLETVAHLYAQQGCRMSITSGNPALIHHCKASEKWRNVDFHGAGSKKRNTNVPSYKDSSQRAVASFEYRGG